MDSFDYDNRIIPIFPRTEENAHGDIDFDMIECFPAGDVGIVDDVEIAKSSIEINGEDSHINFHTRKSLPYLALQLKNLNRFMKIVLKIHDTEGKLRTFTISNRRTTIHINGNSCALPMDFGQGWQYINLNLEDLVSRCFGASLLYVSSVIIHGSTRVGKIYFQDKDYSDAELPAMLRLLKPE